MARLGRFNRMSHYGARMAPPEYERIMMAVRIFMAVKEHAVLAKLAGTRQAANLNEIKQRMDPNNGYWAADWEENHKITFKIPVSAGMLHRVDIKSGNYGFGEDRGYALTDTAIAVIREFREDRRIASAVEDILSELVYGRVRSEFDYFSY